MPLPNRKVVTALIESYLSSRKDEKWYITKEQLKSKDIDKTARQKIDSCEEILKYMQDMENTVQAWADFIYFLYDKDRYEDENQTGNRFGGILKPVWPYSQLWSTVHAIISYINSQLIKEPKFEKIKQSLQEDAQQLTLAIAEDKKRQMPSEISAEKARQLLLVQNKIKALAISNYYTTSHFSAILKKYKDTKELKEENFEQYVANVEKGERKTEFCDYLLQDDVQLQAQPQQPQVKPQTQAQEKPPVEKAQPVTSTPTSAPVPNNAPTSNKSTTTLLNKTFSEVVTAKPKEPEKKVEPVEKRKDEVIIDIEPEHPVKDDRAKVRRSTRQASLAKHSAFPAMSKEEVREQQRAYENLSMRKNKP